MKMKNLLESLCFGDFFEYLNSGFPFLELERRGEERSIWDLKNGFLLLFLMSFSFSYSFMGWH